MSLPSYLPVCLTLALLGGGSDAWASGATNVAQPAAVDVSETLLRSLYPQMTGRVAAAVPRLPGRKTTRGQSAELQGWRILQDERTLGWVLVDEAMGKSRPITWLLAVDAQLATIGVEILAYRESHGGEIKRRDWRAQFRGKNASTGLAHGRDISNIAGATISCRSLVAGVRSNLQALDAALRTGALDQIRVVPAAAEVTLQQDVLTVGEQVPHLRSQLLMGTLLTVMIDEDQEQLALAASSAVFEEVRRLERELSERDPSSQLNSWLKEAAQGHAPLSRELDGMLTQAVRLQRDTNGACDAGMGPLVRLWREAEAAGRRPTEAEVAQCKRACGLKLVERSTDGTTARLLHPEARLDFGGLAKGWALDRAADKLRAMGVTRVLLDFGGQLLALDAPRGQAGWTMQPAAGVGDGAPFELVNASVAVSGDDERGLHVQGRVSHILDPRTGQPVEARAPVMVIAKTALDADAWATAAYVLGDAAIPLAQALGHQVSSQ